MASAEDKTLPTLVATGIPLSHLLAPTKPSSSTSDKCPTALCGSIPASSVLHVAIGHNVSPSDYQRLQHLDLEDPLPIEGAMPVDLEAPPRHTWVISSSRAALHSKLVQEDDPFLRHHGGHPIIKEALNRVEFKYCQTPEQCLLLLQLLHGPPTSIPADDAEPESAPSKLEEMAELPTLLIAWNLLRLFLADDPSDDQAQEDEDQAEGDAHMDVDMDKAERKVSLREGVTLEDYMQLMACLRSTVSQVNPKNPPTLLILEPSLPATDLTFPPPVSSTRGSHAKPGSTAGKKEGPSVKHALRWLFGEEQVLDIERPDEPGEEGSVQRRGEKGLVFRL